MCRNPEKQGVFSIFFRASKTGSFPGFQGTFAELHVIHVQNPCSRVRAMFTAIDLNLIPSPAPVAMRVAKSPNRIPKAAHGDERLSPGDSGNRRPSLQALRQIGTCAWTM
jgi:hypothetical protein